MTGQRSQVKTIQDSLTLDLVTIVTPCTSCKHTPVSSFSIQFWSKVSKVFLSEPGEIKHVGKSDSAGHILEPQPPLRVTPSHSLLDTNIDQHDSKSEPTDVALLELVWKVNNTNQGKRPMSVQAYVSMTSISGISISHKRNDVKRHSRASRARSTNSILQLSQLLQLLQRKCKHSPPFWIPVKLTQFQDVSSIAEGAATTIQC